MYGSGPQPFWDWGPVSRKTVFPQTGVWGVVSGMIQAHYIQAHLLPYGLVPSRPGLVPVMAQRSGTPHVWLSHFFLFL